MLKLRQRVGKRCGTTSSYCYGRTASCLCSSHKRTSTPVVLRSTNNTGYSRALQTTGRGNSTCSHSCHCRPSNIWCFALTKALRVRRALVKAIWCWKKYVSIAFEIWRYRDTESSRYCRPRIWRFNLYNRRAHWPHLSPRSGFEETYQETTRAVKKRLKHNKETLLKEEHQRIVSLLPSEAKRRALLHASEKGASSWFDGLCPPSPRACKHHEMQCSDILGRTWPVNLLVIGPPSKIAGLLSKQERIQK